MCTVVYGAGALACICDDGYTGKYCEVEINVCKCLNITCSGILDATETRDNTLDTQAVLEGTIGTLAFLFLLILAALAMVVYTLITLLMKVPLPIMRKRKEIYTILMGISKVIHMYMSVSEH